MEFSTFKSLLPLKYIVSFLIAAVFTLVLLASLSVIFSFLPPPNWLLSAVYNCSGYFLVFLASVLCAKKVGRRGIFTGLISGNIYMAILIFLGVLFFNTVFDAGILLKIFALSSLCGSIGGIIGINFK